MKIFHHIGDIKVYLRQKQYSGHSIGFIPTMGCLHEGHLSMVRKAARENDIVVVSIFVNPKQFGKNEDFDRYPKSFSRDIELSKQAGAHIIFNPTIEEMYTPNYKTYVKVEKISDVLCGISRPGHFKGVATVVTKLLNIVHSDRAYFGQKDAQQAVIIQQMAEDLNMDTQIIICPTIREESGLALSSRNTYLSQAEKERAKAIYQILNKAEALIKTTRDARKIKAMIRDYLLKEVDSVEYVEIMGARSLQKIDYIRGEVLIAIAAKVGTSRLIDNIVLDAKS